MVRVATLEVVATSGNVVGIQDQGELVYQGLSNSVAEESWVSEDLKLDDTEDALV